MRKSNPKGMRIVDDHRLKGLIVGDTYQIAYMDKQAPDYTWYTGKAVFLRESDDDFGTGEKHCVFRISNSKESVIFPRSSVSLPLEAGA